MKIDSLDAGVVTVINEISNFAGRLPPTKKQIATECQRILERELKIWQEHNNGHYDPTCHYCEA